MATNGNIDHAPTTRKRRKTNESSTEYTEAATRRRAACEACRSRKIRCTRERPACSFCIRRGGDCIYIELAEDKIALDPTTKLIVEKLDVIHRDVTAIRHGARGALGRSDSGLSADILRGEGQHALAMESLLMPQRSNSQFETPQMSQDYLIIPDCAASADTVLSWPIFEKSYQSDVLIQHVWQRSQGDYFPSDDDVQIGIKETDIPALVDSFLQNAHTKNPVCDVMEVVRLGEHAVRVGIGWDAGSCLVLIACALGSVARAFDDTLQEYLDHIDRGGQTHETEARSIGAQADELAAGERFYRLACQRLGCVGHNMLGSQCHFFAGGKW